MTQARELEDPVTLRSTLREQPGPLAAAMTDIATHVRALSGGYWVARTTEGVVEVVRSSADRGAVWFVPAEQVTSVLRSFLSGSESGHRRLVVVARRTMLEMLDVGSDVFDVLAYPLSLLRLEIILRNGFESIDRVIAREAASRALLRTEYEERTLIDIASALAAERNIDTLLAIMLERFRAITGADAGSVWILESEEGAEPARELLRFSVCQNDSRQVDFREITIPVDGRSIVGYAARTGLPVHVADCYDLPPSAPFRFSDALDRETGYQTRSMLTVPMVNRRSRVIGVIQLINRKRDPSRILVEEAAFDHDVIPFSRHEVELATTLAVHAAISLENVNLYEQIQRLFDSFVDASVRAIESRDPATSGHSHRVAALSLGLLETLDGASAGPFAGLRFGEAEFKTLRYASLLHDFGKVTVPETVLLKAKKLHPWELERVEARIRYVMRDLQARALERKLDAAKHRGYGRAALHFPAWDRELRDKLRILERRLQWIRELNEPAVVEQEEIFAIESLGREVFPVWGAEDCPLLTPRDVDALSIRRGSLTREEYGLIKAHVVETWKFLQAIPWTDDLAAVPDVALMHHEKLDGSGYPLGAVGDAIPIQARILAIADIFDALSASDRPYKTAVPLERALDILRYESSAGKLDSDLLDTFIEARVWERSLERLGRLEEFGPTCCPDHVGHPH